MRLRSPARRALLACALLAAAAPSCGGGPDCPGPLLQPIDARFDAVDLVRLAHPASFLEQASDIAAGSGAAKYGVVLGARLTIANPQDERARVVPGPVVLEVSAPGEGVPTRLPGSLAPFEIPPLGRKAATIELTITVADGARRVARILENAPMRYRLGIDLTARPDVPVGCPAPAPAATRLEGEVNTLANFEEFRARTEAGVRLLLLLAGVLVEGAGP
jgi:hypothetical protein